MKLDRSALAVMCADHGVVAEGVSQTGKDVTRIVAENFTKGETSTSKMCRISGTDLYPVDMGMDYEPTGQKEPDMHRILDRKVARGSGNIAREPAMSRTGCLQALLSGMDLAFRLKEMGYEILAAGEMGIGNTTPAAAMSAVLTGLSPEEATGRGAGLSDAGLEKKKKAVEMAVSRFYEKYPEYRNGTKEQYESGELSAMTVLAELGRFRSRWNDGAIPRRSGGKDPGFDGWIPLHRLWPSGGSHQERGEGLYARVPYLHRTCRGGGPSDAGSSGTSSHGNASRRGKRGGCHDPASQDGCKGI